MKLVLGVGVNDSDYPVSRYEGSKQTWVCPYYSRWSSMLTRCYSNRYVRENPSYEGCYVADEWLTFSVFRKWMLTQDWVEKYLDKDLLFKGNKEYGPNTCVFVTREVNNFIVEKNNGLLPGVHYDVSRDRYRTKSEGRNLGSFKTEKAAHLAWLDSKRKLAFVLAERQDNERVKSALIERYK